MAVTTSHDDGFREIQLSGKQLVFLFMAVTVVLVVTFLTGVLVGRGVRAERTETAQVESTGASPAAPPRATPSAPADDPRSAAPPAPVDDEADAKGSVKTADSDEPPVAAPRNRPDASAAPAASTPAPKAAVAAKASSPVEPVKPQPAAAPAPAPAVKAAAPAVNETPVAAVSNAAATQQRSGYAVQVAAVNARGEADAIVKRLSGKGYSAYVETPKGNTAVFRVRVGTFKTRREAQTVADKLKKEEKFKPWVTR